MGRSVFEINTLMPAGTTRQAVLKIFRDHQAMIRLNPLTYGFKAIEPPPFASADDSDSQWYEIRDRIEYLPGGLWPGNIVYQACFCDREDSLETHTYAPMGIKTVSKWVVPETCADEVSGEVGTNDDGNGSVYLREEVEMTCNTLLLRFVKGAMMDAHRDMAKLLGEEAARMSLASRLNCE